MVRNSPINFIQPNTNMNDGHDHQCHTTTAGVLIMVIVMMKMMLFATTTTATTTMLVHTSLSPLSFALSGEA